MLFEVPYLALFMIIFSNGCSGCSRMLSYLSNAAALTKSFFGCITISPVQNITLLTGIVFQNLPFLHREKKKTLVNKIGLLGYMVLCLLLYHETIGIYKAN